MNDECALAPTLKIPQRYVGDRTAARGVRLQDGVAGEEVKCPSAPC